MDGPHRSSENPASLLGDVVAGLGRLVKGEIALAKAEAKRSVQDATSAIVKLVIAAILAITALNVLAGAAVAGVVELGLSPFWASLLVGVVLLLIAGGVLQYALHLLKPSNLAPRRSFDNLRRDAETLKTMGEPGATDIRS